MYTNVIAILLSLAMLITGAGTVGTDAPARLETPAARVLTISDVTVTRDEQTVKLDPSAVIGVMTDGVQAVFDSHVELGGQKLLPVQLVAEAGGLLGHAGGLDISMNAEEIDKLLIDKMGQEMDDQGKAMLSFYTDEYIPAYAGLMELLSDQEKLKGMQADFDRAYGEAVDRGEGVPAQIEYEGETYDGLIYNYVLDSAAIGRVADAIYDSNDAMRRYKDAYFGLLQMLGGDAAELGNVQNYEQLMAAVDMRMSVTERLSEADQLDLSSMVLQISIPDMDDPISFEIISERHGEDQSANAYGVYDLDGKQIEFNVDSMVEGGAMSGSMSVSVSAPEAAEEADDAQAAEEAEGGEIAGFLSGLLSGGQATGADANDGVDEDAGGEAFLAALLGRDASESEGVGADALLSAIVDGTFGGEDAVDGEDAMDDEDDGDVDEADDPDADDVAYEDIEDDVDEPEDPDDEVYEDDAEYDEGDVIEPGEEDLTGLLTDLAGGDVEAIDKEDLEADVEDEESDIFYLSFDYDIEPADGGYTYDVNLNLEIGDDADASANLQGTRRADGTSQNQVTLYANVSDSSLEVSFNANVTDAPFDVVASAESAVPASDMDKDTMMMSMLGDAMQLLSDPSVQALATLFGADEEGAGPADVPAVDDPDTDVEGRGAEPYDDDSVSFGTPQFTWLPEGFEVTSTDVDTQYDMVDCLISNQTTGSEISMFFSTSSGTNTRSYTVSQDGTLTPVEGPLLSEDGDDDFHQYSYDDGHAQINVYPYGADLDAETIGRILAGITYADQAA